MKCKEVRDLILTDFSDDQMAEGEKARIQAHLEQCRECKEFFLAVKKSAVEPFVNADRVEPPASLWPQIREAIIAGQQEEEGFAHTLRPALSIATIIILFFVAGVITTVKISNQQALKIAAQDEIESLTYSVEASADAFLNGGTGLGTEIEEYFL